MNISLSRRLFLLFTGFLFIAAGALTSCQKQISYDVSPPGGTTGGTAAFALVPSGTNCSDAAVSGNFAAGTVLTTSSFITVTVNVTAAGTWSYTTATVNGYLFAGTGTFSATGAQSITLQAAGTPLAAGDNTFSLNIGTGSNCSVKVTVGPAGSTGGTSDIYYKATIGGVSYSQYVTDNNGYEGGSGMGGVDDVSFGGDISYANGTIPPGLTQMGVTKGLMHHYLSATDAQFKAFFAPGDYPYAPSSFSNGDGVHIGWSDPAGEYWDTRDGPADQVGSTFKIVSVVDSPDALGRYYIKVKMQFSCKLYNVTTGAVKQLTNGEMVVYFGKL